MIGVIRFGGGEYYFEPDYGNLWRLSVPVGFGRRPRFLDERVIVEGLHMPDDALMLHRISPIGYAVPAPAFLGFRMLFGVRAV